MVRWFAILCLLQVVPFWRIFGRMGFPRWLAIPASVPLVNLLVLYYVAMVRWPRDPSAGDATHDADFR